MVKYDKYIHSPPETYIEPVSPEEYFTQTLAAFFRAVEHTQDIRRYYRIAGFTFCVRFAGDALLPQLTLTLAPHEVVAAPPDFTLHCFDSASTRIAVPVPPWDGTAYGAKGHIIGYNNQDIHTLYQPGVDILQLWRSSTTEGIYWIERAVDVPYWEGSMPFRSLLHWWTRNQELQLVHAAAIGTERAGILLTGKSGSGKSTTALACREAGLACAGDDYVMVSTAAEPYVHALYSIAKLLPDALELLPQLKQHVLGGDVLRHEKALIDLRYDKAEPACKGFPIRAIFLPRVTGGMKTSLRPATAAQSLLALAPTTIAHLEGGEREAFEKIRRLVYHVPSYWLDLGTDMGGVGRAVKHFLENL